MRPAFAALLAAAVLAPAAVAVAQGWTTQTFAAEGFSVEAPVLLERQPTETVPDAGKMHVFVGRTDKVAYMATATSIDGVEGAGQAAPDDVAASVMVGALEGQTKVSERPSTFPGGAARDFTLRTSDGLMIRNRVVYRSPWIYSNMVMAAEADGALLDGADATRFLNSVKAVK